MQFSNKDCFHGDAKMKPAQASNNNSDEQGFYFRSDSSLKSVCAVCCESKSSATDTSCRDRQHAFHTSCLRLWKVLSNRQHLSCPVCQGCLLLHSPSDSPGFALLQQRPVQLPPIVLDKHVMDKIVNKFPHERNLQSAVAKFMAEDPSQLAPSTPDKWSVDDVFTRVQLPVLRSILDLITRVRTRHHGLQLRDMTGQRAQVDIDVVLPYYAGNRLVPCVLEPVVEVRPETRRTWEKGMDKETYWSHQWKEAKPSWH